MAHAWIGTFKILFASFNAAWVLVDLGIKGRFFILNPAFGLATKLKSVVAPVASVTTAYLLSYPISDAMSSMFFIACLAFSWLHFPIDSGQSRITAIFSCVTCLLLLPIWDKYERGMRKKLVTMKLVSFLVGTCCNAKKSKWVKKINKWITCSATSPQGADIRRHWHQNPNEVQVWTVFSRSRHRANLIFLHRT